MSQIPTEIFLKIVSHSLASCRDPKARNGRFSSAGGFVKCLQSLAQVSARWAEIIKSTAELWTFLDSWCSPEQSSWFIEKSKGLDLDVTYHGTYFPLAADAELRFFLEFEGSSRRWRSFQLRSWTRDIIRRVSVSSFPKLSILKLFGSEVRTEAPTAVLEDFRPEAPIQHLKLHQVTIPWTSGVLNRLKTLDIELHYRLWMPRGPSSPSLSQLIQILRQCPDLQQLRLHDNFEKQVRDVSSAPRDSVALTKLELLDLHMAGRYIQQLLEEIEIDSCSELVLDVTNALGQATLTHTPYFQAIESAIDTSLYIKMAIKPHSSVQMLWSWREDIGNQGHLTPRQIQLICPNNPQTVDINRLLPLTAPSLRHLKVEELDRSHHWLEPIFDLTRAVTEVTAYDLSTSGAEHLMNALGERHGGWPLPQLRKLTLKFGKLQVTDFDGDSLLRVAAERETACTPDGSSWTVESLREILLIGCPVKADMLTELRAVVPDVSWQPI